MGHRTDDLAGGRHARQHHDLDEFDEGQRWLQRTAVALQSESGSGIGVLTYMATGMLEAGRGRLGEVLKEFSAAERL